MHYFFETLPNAFGDALLAGLGFSALIPKITRQSYADIQANKKNATALLAHRNFSEILGHGQSQGVGMSRPMGMQPK